VGEWILELTFCLLGVLKNEFGEVSEAMFDGVERLYELVL
jgi:hypothetical protein